MIFNDFFITLV